MNKTESSDLQTVLNQFKGSFFSVMIFSMFINLLMLTPAIYMLQLYDRVVPTGNKMTLLMLTLIVFLLFMTLGLLEWVRSQVLLRVGFNIEVLLNKRLFWLSHKQALLSGGQQVNSQLLDDLTSLRQFMSSPVLFAFFDAPWIPVYIAVMFIFHTWFGWLAVFTAIILTAIALINEKVTSKILTEVNSQSIALRAFLNQQLANAEVIESMGMLADIRKHWLESNNPIQQLQLKAGSRAGALSSLSRILRISVQSLTLGLGAYLVIEREITPGLMIAGSILLGRALAPIDQMITGWKGFINARSQYKRLNEILLRNPVEAEKMSLPAPKGNLVVENAVVIPPGGKRPCLKNISFSISQGEVVGILGASGAGKSSLARALLGVWPAIGGKIRLDGANIFDWERQSLGKFIGYLPQEIELFEGSISQNIARFGEIDPEKVITAAKMADVHELILRLSEGYDTIIGPKGGTLSAGQRQRIGLARALYDNPVFIVLDEPNSNLDDQGEQALTQAIQKLKNLKTTICIITHRPNILNEVDKLLILKEGSLTGFGAKDEIMNQLKQATSNASIKKPSGNLPSYSVSIS